MLSNDFHALEFTAADGTRQSMAQFKGKKLLIINTASECGYTPQYAQMEDLYRTFQEQGIEVVAFPCNDFGAQEPGSIREVALFCETTYGVTFPLGEKVNILAEPRHEVYQWLTSKQWNGIGDFEVTWNFQKFAVDEKGALVAVYTPGTSPLDIKILDWIQQPSLF